MVIKNSQEVSIDSLTGTDLCLLDKIDIRFPTEIECSDNGIQIQIPERSKLHETTQKMRKMGFSSAFIDVIISAYKSNHSWINLDYALSSIPYCERLIDIYVEDALSEIKSNNKYDSKRNALETLKYFNWLTFNYSTINDLVFVDLIMDLLEYSNYRGWDTQSLYNEALRNFLADVGK